MDRDGERSHGEGRIRDGADDLWLIAARGMTTITAIIVGVLSLGLK